MVSDSDTEARRREAADWFSRLSRTRVTGDEVRAFSAWRKVPANAAAYREVEAVWEASGALGRDPELRAALESARSPAPRPARIRIGPARLAALGAVVLGIGVAIWWAGRPLDLATRTGEQRTVVLEDGSRVVLDTDSRIRVALRDDRRTVWLDRGQAYFTVHGDPSRPFAVRAGQTEVVATGTQFGVRRFAAGAEVTLVEGSVTVAEEREGRWTLTPGQRVATQASRPQVSPVDARTATSWREGRLVFDRMRLADAVTEVNRYTDAKLELGSPDLAGVRVSGVFHAGDVDGFVAAVSDLYGLAPAPGPDGGRRLVRADAQK